MIMAGTGHFEGEDDKKMRIKTNAKYRRYSNEWLVIRVNTASPRARIYNFRH